ncbi:MAG: hypothetical protein RQ875_02925 [Vicingaceae bacterium]|nr:hypothetical protein [Vicingaceae bacterium]
MNWTEIFKEIGIVGIVSGLLVWLFKQLGMHFIDRKFKAYELKLQTKSDDYKHELNLSFNKASKLHDRRLEKIERLYQNVVRLNSAMQMMTAKWKVVSGDEKKDEEEENKRIEHAGDCYNKFLDFYTENRIFFSEETCIILDKLKTDYFDSFWDYTAKKRFGYTDFKLNWELATKASDKVKKEIPPVLSQLENDFRTLIGVIDV